MANLIAKVNMWCIICTVAHLAHRTRSPGLRAALRAFAPIRLARKRAIAANPNWKTIWA